MSPLGENFKSVVIGLIVLVVVTRSQQIMNYLMSFVNAKAGGQQHGGGPGHHPPGAAAASSAAAAEEAAPMDEVCTCCVLHVRVMTACRLWGSGPEARRA